MGLDDLLAKLERAAGTAGTAGVPAAVPANPLKTLAGTAGTAGTAEKDKGGGDSSQSTARGCSTCRYRKRPGLSAGYCGGGRDDLPAAYGLHHPLRKLPDDQGAGCASYLPHEG